jgi:PAS domain S-box-containing protein
MNADMGETPCGEPRPGMSGWPTYACRAMNNNKTSHPEEPAGAKMPCGTDLARRIHVLDDEIVNLVALPRLLPCRADRQRILDQVNLVLAEARAIAEQSDRCFALLSAGRPVECTKPSRFWLERGPQVPSSEIKRNPGSLKAMKDKGLPLLKRIESQSERAGDCVEPMGETVPPPSLLTQPLESPSALRTSEIRYRRLFEAARDGILILDSGTRKITDANPFMSELLGYPREGLLGKELWEIGLLQDEAASRAAFRELQTNRFIRYENLPLQTKAGERHEVEFVSNLYDEDGRTVIQCNIRDITQRKRTENALRQAKTMLANHAAEQERLVAERTATLRETVGELQAFSYSVAHDMRSPLRSMQGFAQLLLDDYRAKLDAQGVHYLQQIMRSAVRLDRLIRDVLNYSSILHAANVMEPVDLDRLVRDLIQTYPNGHKTEIHIQGKLPKVLGNEAFLTQCFANLLSNAAKFVSPGTSPHIEVRAEDPVRVNRETQTETALPSTLPGPGSAAVRIWVVDNGIGIAR